MKDLKQTGGGSDWLSSLDQKLGRATGQAVDATLRDVAVKRAGGSEQVVSFRCARSGAPFIVRVARATSGEKFRIVAVEKAGTGGQRGPAQPETASTSYDAAQIDFSGWYCPHCQFSGAPSFIQCNKCRRLVCGGTVVTLGNGARTFACEPACGSSGALSGEIRSYDTERHQPAKTAPPRTAASAHVSLPKPDRPLLPKLR